MRWKGWSLLVLPSILAFAIVFAWLRIAKAQGSGWVSGIVVDQAGPVPGARVRVRATQNYTLTASNGQFVLRGLEEGQKVEVTAWSDGYYIAYTYITPTVIGITLTLRPYHTEDHPDYAWASPISGTSSSACGNCHPMIMPQWVNNAHGGAISNPRFFSLYNGTDLSGSLKIGPGYSNDFPGTSGNCANCHAPGAGVDGYLTTNMNAVRGEITAGIHCDYCHKIGGVYLNPATGSVYPNSPGVRNQRILRPPSGDNIFFGPYDDIHDPDTYLPLISESQYCASCHQFSFWGTPIYESYDEWLNSPYADAGVTCQKCHMLPNGDTFFALPGVGGREHPAETIPSHLDLGAKDIDLLQNTVVMSVAVRQIWDRLQVTVVITNTNAGHKVPTDYPGRHMILTLESTDSHGSPLPQLAGPTVPAWGGSQAGLPGSAYAKLLRDVKSGEFPVVSYWKQALIESDNRLDAFEASRTDYTFALSSGEDQVNFQAELIFRRVFQDLASQKGWDMPDILMEAESLTISTSPIYRIYLPVID